ncbi:hypothetical protein, partial [Enterovibrio norvegicus]
RTEVHGFAIRCIATLPTRLLFLSALEVVFHCGMGRHFTDSRDLVNTNHQIKVRSLKIAAKAV